MRILHVIDQISQKTAGGSAKVCFQMAESQAKLGHSVTIYTTDYNAKNQEAPQGVKMHKFHVWFSLGGLRIAPAMFAPPNPSLLNDWEEQFDVMHVHNYRTFTALVAGSWLYSPRWLSRHYVPLVLQAHGNAAPLTKKHWTQGIWRNGIISHVDACIADAPSEISHYEAESKKPNKCEVIPVGIDLSEFQDLPPRQHSGKFEVLYLGRIHPIKGIDLLIDAVSQCPDVHLTIAGNDENGYEYDLKNQVVRLGIADRVDFAGPLYGRDKVRAYVNVDLYAMTSRYEMWGVTYMEALSCSTPVLMTTNSEMSKVLPRYCGMAVSPDVESIARGIRMAQSAQLRCQCQQERRAWVRQYDWSVVTPKIIKLYEEVIKNDS